MSGKIIPGMPMEAYLGGNWWTRSKLELAWSDPALCHAQHVERSSNPDPPGLALMVGRAVNDLALGITGDVSNAIVVDVASECKAFKEAIAENPGRIVLTRPGHELATACAEALHRHEWWRSNVVGREGVRVENTVIVDDEHVGMVAVRPDALFGRTLVELKTAVGPKGGSKEPFRNWWAWEMRKRGYHRQVALYLDALYRLTGKRYDHRIVVVEKSDAPKVRIYRLPDDGTPWSLATGLDEINMRKRHVGHMLTTGVWEEPETSDYVTLDNEELAS